MPPGAEAEASPAEAPAAVSGNLLLPGNEDDL